MMKIHLKLLLNLLVITFAILACNYPGLEDDLPTPAPTSAPEETLPTEIISPTEAPEEPPMPMPPVTPLTIEAEGVKVSYGPESTQCEVEQTIILAIRNDVTAELSATGPDIVDHYNCTASGEETWYVNGVADPTSETVTFSSCNFGGFSASGTMTYGGGRLSGEVACIDKNGGKAVTLTADLIVENP